VTATITAYDELVASLLLKQIPRHLAERAAREHLGITSGTPEVSARDASILEKTEQREIIKLFREHGCTVRSTSQARPSKIALGFPDLFVTHKRLPLAFFWESKRQVKGVISDAQQDFAEDCWRCGVRWYAGDRFDAERVLDELHVPRIP
jgi:hypothetical protein